MTQLDLVDLIIKEFYDESNNTINLTNLDFELESGVKPNLNISGIRGVTRLTQSKQEAFGIYQGLSKAKIITQTGHKVNEIIEGGHSILETNTYTTTLIKHPKKEEV